MTCIMGKSGIGKSTLLSILMGLEKADEGTVSGMEHQKISAIFQENRLFENLDAVTNIHITTGKTKEEITGFLKKRRLPEKPFFLSRMMRKRQNFSRQSAWNLSEFTQKRGRSAQ